MSPDLTIMLLAAILVVGLIAMLFAILAFVAARRSPPQPVTREETQALLRQEGDAIRSFADTSTRGLRQELDQKLNNNHNDLVDRVVKSSVTLRDTIEQRMDATLAQQGIAAHGLRDELSGSFQRMRQGVGETLQQASDHQRERLDATQAALRALSEISKAGSEQLRSSVEQRLDLLRTENASKLEEMRRTVDEQLQTTLEKRLGESFNQVVDQLSKAYVVFGEVQKISESVGDLKNVLTNPKLRGTFGEVQLGRLLEDFLAPHQYIKNAQVKPESLERVEYAVRHITIEGGEMLLPIDAKFPREDHEHMVEALHAGNPVLAEQFRKQLENRIKTFAKDVSRKYINSPHTTEFAILFLPTESLFYEVLRMPGLVEFAQRECSVILAGPTTLSAILHAFQANHRSITIAKRSGEVRAILSAVRTEFKRYNDAVDTVAKQLRTVSGSVDKLNTRTRAMDRKLKDVEIIPEEESARLLGFNGQIDSSQPEAELEARSEAEDELEAAADNIAIFAGSTARAP
jgi:DNA recombination protein RmuC